MKFFVGMALYSAIFYSIDFFEGKKSSSVILFSAFLRLFSTFIRLSCGSSLFFMLVGAFLSSNVNPLTAKPIDWYHLSGKGQSRPFGLNGWIF